MQGRRTALRQRWILVQPVAAVQAAGELERLALRASRRRVGGEVAGGGDQRQGGLVRAAQQLCLARGRLDALDGVEVAVLAEEAASEHGHESSRCAAGDEIG